MNHEFINIAQRTKSVKLHQKLCLFSVFLFLSVLANAQAVLNNGGNINALQGSFIYVNGAVVNNNGGEIVIDALAMDNAEMYVTGDITNNATIADDGHIRLLGNWFDNGVFVGGTGTVFLEGGAQILGGTSETVFNNLTLDGTDSKTQTIDKYCSGILNLKHIELKTETNVFFVLNTNIDAVMRTSGFVSSLNGGKLSRATNQTATYLFPVGSSVGAFRYRPVEITPNSTSASTYAVRLANLDANLEGYDRSQTEMEICRMNELFYHQIARTSGSSAADISISFDMAADGDWEGIANWKIPSTEWQVVDGSYVTAGAPFDEAIKTAWNDFSSEPYILYNANVVLSFDPIGPLCQGSAAPSLPAVSNEGIPGTWSPSVINTSTIGFFDYTFTPNLAMGCYLPYTMTVEIENCCSMALTATVTNPLCNGDNGLITMTQTGGVNPVGYSYNGVAGTAVYSAPAGNYVIIATDVFGCTATTTANIVQPAQLNVFASAVAATCGGTGGSAFASVVGGTAGYDFLWSPGGQIVNNISNQPPGTYTVVVTDNNDCTASQSVEIGITGFLSADLQLTNPITCPGEENAVLELVSHNGQGMVNFGWSNGAFGQIAANLGAGNYVLTFTDSWGCQGSESFLVTEPSALLFSAVINDVSCYGYNDGSIDPNVSGGTPPYNYYWSTGSPFEIITTLVAGDYSLSLTDFNGCPANQIFTVSQPNELVFLNQISHVTCFGDNNGAIAMSASGGTYPYHFMISQGGAMVSGNNFYGLSPGYYYISVSDDNGCYDTANVIISEPAPITASYTYSNPSCIRNSDGYVELNVSGGTAPYLFGWLDYYIDIPLISGLIEGAYDISIVDANNCEYEINAITLTDIDEDCIRIPNAFTPNGDGPNDEWLIHNIELFPRATITVYNRWGQLLFTGRGDGDPWDGTYNGRFVPAGSYLYVIQLYNRNADYTGVVTVVY